MTDPTARSLIQRLADALAEWQLGGAPPEDTADADLISEARAYLAAPDEPAVPAGREPASVAYEPSDEELLELMPETLRDEFSYAATVCSDATGGQVKPGIFRVALNTAALEYARAVLARWGGRCDKTSTPVKPMNIFCRKGDLVRLLTPTVSAWQGIGIAAETVYDDGDPDTVVPFYKQDQSLEDQAPSIALIGDVELVRPTDRQIDRLYWQCEQNPQGYRDLIRNFLARHGGQPEPEGPTDEELANTYWKAWHEYHDRTNSVLHAAGLRAVLARWGSHAPAPIPLSERLPTEADCNAEGKCLLFGRYLLSGEAAWIYGRPAWAHRFAICYSHWLPHWALPVPGVEA